MDNTFMDVVTASIRNRYRFCKTKTMTTVMADDIIAATKNDTGLVVPLWVLIHVVERLGGKVYKLYQSNRIMKVYFFTY